ncbi:hypothetical protein CHU98_g11210 [Xylaria longipes]|nr:hypothetical protein CHU98_g11210 [Xylaria longipes]
MEAVALGIGVLTLVSFASSAIQVFIVDTHHKATAKPQDEERTEIDESKPQFAYELQPLRYSQLGESYHPRRRQPPEYQRNEKSDGCAGWRDREP